ncbi:hypothetical protein PIB30_020304 [Stylosanthes scabra]|uniref:Uncharacterized protein n=1 Tax=Stylosanthes scabra TaxID=79078 RepID=A0ABU6W9I2_9FABA|nr:hypothetical protein [Stylosanthes scabra]
MREPRRCRLCGVEGHSAADAPTLLGLVQVAQVPISVPLPQCAEKSLKTNGPWS